LIREAEARDKDAIQFLYQVLCPHAPVRVLSERIEQIRKDPTNFVYIYEDDGKVLGTVFFTFCLSPMYGWQPFGVAENFIVDERYRGQGIGGLLINHVFQIARENKCFAVKVFSGSSREKAHQFFEKNGFNSGDKRAFIKYLNREN
jgi:GNAT superfamily N-acetyltransferase